MCFFVFSNMFKIHFTILRPIFSFRIQFLDFVFCTLRPCARVFTLRVVRFHVSCDAFSRIRGFVAFARCVNMLRATH